MTIEWIRFGIVAALMIFGLLVIFTSLLGVFRFRFALNRMHTASIIDTLGFMIMVVALLIAPGFEFGSVKLIMIVVFMWAASPISSHLISELEITTNDEIREHVTIESDKEEEVE